MNKNIPAEIYISEPDLSEIQQFGALSAIVSPDKYRANQIRYIHIPSLFHDAIETPSKSFLIFFRTSKDEYVVDYYLADRCPWEEYVKTHDVVQWMYMEDIIY